MARGFFRSGRARPIAWCSMAAIAVIAQSIVARAAAVSLDLEWRAPVGCPDKSAVRKYVEEMLGTSEAATSVLSARGTVARTNGDRWTADLTLRSSAGAESNRSFEGPTCESVTRAAALVMALTLHPNDAPPPAPSPPPERPPPDRDVVTRPPPRNRFRQPAVAPQGAFAVGALPGPAAGIALALGWSPVPPLRWDSSFAYFFARRATLTGQNGLGADMSLAAFALRGCYPVLDAALSLAPCAGGGADWIRASGFGARAPYDGSGLIGNVRAGAIVLYNFNDFAAARLEVEGVLSTSSPEFVIDGAGTVYHRNPGSLRASAGLEIHF